MRALASIKLLSGSLLAGSLMASCILDRDGGAPAGGGGAAAAPPTGGSGGAQCTEPGDCPGKDGACVTRRCVQGQCDAEYAPYGTACSENLGQQCNGSGACVREPGHPCHSAADCLSGYCVDELCCETACDGPCVSCDLPAAPGTCTPHEVGTDVGADCLQGICDGGGHCAAGSTTAGRGFGDVYADDGLVVAVDPDGDVVVAGAFSGTIDLGGGVLDAGTDGPDVFVAKLDPALGHQWSRKLGGTGAQVVTALAIDSGGNVVVGGHFDGSIDAGGGALTSVSSDDIWLAKLDPDGGHVWSKRFGGNDSQLLAAIALDPQDDIVLAGSFRDELDFAGGAPLPFDFNWDLFVAKLDPSGNHLWSHGYGDFWDEVAADVAVDGAGRVTVIGSFDDDVSFGGPMLYADGQDVLLLRLSSDGDYQWSLQLGQTGDQTGVAIDTNADGELLIGGNMLGTMTLGQESWTTDGSQDVLLAKLTVSGQVVWSRFYGAAGTQSLGEATFDPWGNVVFGGSSDGDADFGGGVLSSAGLNDAFAGKLAPAGEYLWAHQYGDLYEDRFADVAAGADGALYATGSFAGSIDLGGGTVLNSLGLSDVLLVALEP